jgi:hypothetical protein
VKLLQRRQTDLKRTKRHFLHTAATISSVIIFLAILWLFIDIATLSASPSKWSLWLILPLVLVCVAIGFVYERPVQNTFLASMLLAGAIIVYIKCPIPSDKIWPQDDGGLFRLQKEIVKIQLATRDCEVLVVSENADTYPPSWRPVLTFQDKKVIEDIVSAIDCIPPVPHYSPGAFVFQHITHDGDYTLEFMRNDKRTVLTVIYPKWIRGIGDTDYEMTPSAQAYMWSVIPVSKMLIQRGF